jgi:hypothetical protein
MPSTILIKILPLGVAESIFTISEMYSIHLARKAEAIKVAIRNRDVHK